MAINKLLVANRGEIACRIIRTAKALGIRTVAVYSEADTNAPHVRAADESVAIGSALPAHSYLSIDNVCQAIKSSGADAVHPGYGFLSESAEFAKRVIDNGVTFVGPSVNAIRTMGNKGTAKRLMQTAGVSCLAGYNGADQSDGAFRTAAQSIGYPVMVKAAAGGGGRGMRLVTDAAQLEEALALARAEALAGFNNDELILEKALIAPRHIEVQVLADDHGNCIHLGERDCSIQRRHQKLVEEAPCASMSSELREKMGAAAVKAAQAVNYSGAGTVEFLLDGDDTFYFLEMNTRLQVEHPVTEMITGYDLVAMQLQIANGQSLPINQQDVSINGHAIEVRLCAEKPAADFVPTSGTIHRWQTDLSTEIRSGIRIDAGIEDGFDVSPWYDTMLAKVIGWGETREQARCRLSQALTEIVLLGPATNQQFLHSVVTSDSFIAGKADTAFIQNTWPDGYPATIAGSSIQAIAIAILAANDVSETLTRTASVIDTDLIGWSSANALSTPVMLTTANGLINARVRASAGGRKWQITRGCVTQSRVTQSQVTQEHETLAHQDDDGTVSHPCTNWQHNVEFDVPESMMHQPHGFFRDRNTTTDTRIKQQNIHVVVDQARYRISYVLHRSESNNDTLWLGQGCESWEFTRATSDTATTATTAGKITAPMHGTIAELLVKEGQAVESGQTLAILEAMKMQHQICAETAGTVTRLSVNSGAQVQSGDLLIEIASDDSSDTATD